MIWAPKEGQRVRIHYAIKKGKKILPPKPLQDMVAVIVEIPRRGRGPRNVLVKLDDGRLIIVSRGHLVAL